MHPSPRVRHAAMLAAGILAAACQPVHYRMQSAAGLAPDQVAVAKARRSLFGPEAVLWGIDGERAGRFTTMSEADLPPGPHLLNVGYKEGGLFTQSYSVGTVPICLVAESGHRYEIRTGQLPREHFLQLDGYWRPWIVDLGSGEVVSSRPASGSDPLGTLPATFEVLSLHSCWARGTLDPQAAPRTAVAALARELGGDGDAVTCQGQRADLATTDAPPREWAARFAAVRTTIQPCLKPAERDTMAAYDHAVARRIVRRIPGAAFVTKEEAKDESDTASIGVDLYRDGTETIVMDALAGAPAAEAGVRAGDRLVQIGDVNTRELPLSDVADLLHGPNATTVSLAIVRGGEMRSIPVTREVVKLAFPAAEWLEDGIGYVRIRTLEKGTAEPFAKAMKELRGARGVVVDLRANRAGPINTTVNVAGLLLSPGQAVLTTIEPGQMIKSEPGVELTGGMLHIERTARDGDLLGGVPVVAITDEFASGSAAIVAAAWRAHHRATVIGERPGGSDRMLQWFGIVGTAAAHLPAGRLLAPDGRSIEEASTPDVVVDARRPLSGRREDDAALARAVAILRTPGSGSP